MSVGRVSLQTERRAPNRHPPYFNPLGVDMVKAKTARSSNETSSRKSKTRPNDIAPYRLTTEVRRKSGIPFVQA